MCNLRNKPHFRGALESYPEVLRGVLLWQGTISRIGAKLAIMNFGMLVLKFSCFVFLMRSDYF